MQQPEKARRYWPWTPHYPPSLVYPQMYGAETIEYALKSDDGWCIDLDDIESKMDSDVRLLVLINPNNPTEMLLGRGNQKITIYYKKMAKRMIVADEITMG